MTRTRFRALPALLAILLLPAGCAGTRGTAGGPATGAGNPPPAAPASSAACAGSLPSRLSLSEVDSGARRCLAPGGTVEVYLHGTATDRWSPITLTGTALRVAPSGKGALPVGVTGGFFAAAGTGEAVLTGYRGPCASSATGSTGPAGAAQCDPAHLFRVTVLVP